MSVTDTYGGADVATGDSEHGGEREVVGPAHSAFF